jgi:eukaryotic-like serine/threonine-protein kinase
VVLSPGTRVGVYEVTGPLGAGGMGEVYRATDANLKRAVAIKVLPAAVAADAEGLARSSGKPKSLRRSIIQASPRFTAWRRPTA